jgi:upstream activation factor subunit UAF30
LIEIINEADLETCSAKSVRKGLEAELQVSLDEHKDTINEVINEAILNRLSEEEGHRKKSNGHQDLGGIVSNGTSEGQDEDLDDEELARRLQEAENANMRPSRRAAAKVKGKKLVRKESSRPRNTANNPFNKLFLLSEPLSKLVGAKEMSRPQVVKHIWAYVKEHNLQDPKDRRILVCDELMLPVMKKPKISCFAMNKILSDHLIHMEDTVGSIAKRAKIDNELVDSESIDEMDVSDDDI